MNNDSFWIGLPNGWSRTSFDPEYRRQVDATLSDTAKALPELAGQCAELRSLLDESSLFSDEDDTNAVLFAAQYYASPEPGHAIHCVLAICALHRFDARAIDDDSCDHTTFDQQRQPQVKGDTDDQDGPAVRRRTTFETGPAHLDRQTTATAQYFVTVPGAGHSLVVSFSTTSVPYWPELLDQFDAIVATIEFPDAA